MLFSWKQEAPTSIGGGVRSPTTESTAIWPFNENPTVSGSYYCRILFCGDGSGNLRAVGSGSDNVKISKIIGFKI